MVKKLHSRVFDGERLLPLFALVDENGWTIIQSRNEALIKDLARILK